QAPAPTSLQRVDLSIRNWFKQYDFRFVRGVPFSRRPEDEPETESLLWVRDYPERALDFASLTALGDVFAPRVFLLRQSFTPSGTVSMTHYFHATGEELLLASGFLLGQARATRLHRNYADQIAHLWSEDGARRLTSTQPVYCKESRTEGPGALARSGGSAANAGPRPQHLRPRRGGEQRRPPPG